MTCYCRRSVQELFLLLHASLQVRQDECLGQQCENQSQCPTHDFLLAPCKHISCISQQCLTGGGLAQLVATLVRSTKLLYVGPVSTGMGDRIGVQLPLWEIYLSLTNHPGQLSLAIPSWVGGAMSTGQRAVMFCDWGVKADMVLFAGNTVWSISELVRGVCIHALYISTFTYYLLY